jgi:hypothetical protein
MDEVFREVREYLLFCGAASERGGGGRGGGVRPRVTFGSLPQSCAASARTAASAGIASA